MRKVTIFVYGNYGIVTYQHGRSIEQDIKVINSMKSLPDFITSATIEVEQLPAIDYNEPSILRGLKEDS